MSIEPGRGRSGVSGRSTTLESEVIACQGTVSPPPSAWVTVNKDFSILAGYFKCDGTWLA